MSTHPTLCEKLGVCQGLDPACDGCAFPVATPADAFAPVDEFTPPPESARERWALRLVIVALGAWSAGMVCALLGLVLLAVSST